MKKSGKKAILELAARDATFRARLLQELDACGVKIELLKGGTKGTTVVVMAKPIPVVGAGPGSGQGPKPPKPPKP